jgi:hypothetical protein
MPPNLPDFTLRRCTDMKNVYGKKFILRLPLNGIECWNFTDGSTGKFNVGESVEVLHIYDTTHTVIQCEEKDGRPVFLNGDHKVSPHSGERVMGYRFIAPNLALWNAIGVKRPRKTADLVGDLIAHETGNATPIQQKRLFRTLRKSGIGAKLQGHYSSQM